jgi:hypothetical protein
VSKISELSDGGSLVSSDYLIAVRSGGNVKVRMDQINVDQVDLGDNEFIRLGNSQDLTMVHTSTQSIINQAGTGDLLIQKAGATKASITANGLEFPDNSKAIFGAGSDLEIYHDGNNSYIKDGGTGDLRIWADSPNIATASGNKIFYGNSGYAELYAAGGAIRLATTSTGIDVTGTVTADGLEIATSVADTGVDLTLNGNKSTNGGIGSIIFENAGDSVGMIRSNRASANDAADMLFYTQATGGANTERMRIDASGNVGIGNTSPDSVLEVNFTTSGSGANNNTAGSSIGVGSSSTTQPVLGMRWTGASHVGISGSAFSTQIVNDTANSNAFEMYTTGATPLVFGTAATERMRIDASGNLLVGKSTASFGTVGAALYASGDNDFVNDSNVMSLNRLGSDGSIFTFYKDTVAVGSIGTGSGDLNINGPAGHSGIRFQASSILPRYNGSDTDGTMDLGYDDGTDIHRWRNLYLSGGVVFSDAGGSGTSSSNTLDSYEEGSWTPVLTKSTTAPSVTYTTQAGTYAKVGRIIYVSGLLNWTAISGGSGDFRIAGLPFTILNAIGAFPQMVSTDYNGVTFGANDATFGGYGATNGTHILLLAAKNNATTSTPISGLATAGFMYFNLTYQAA